MIPYEDLVAQLRRTYERDSGFWMLSRPESYPYKVSVRPPSFELMLKDIAGVWAWQESYEKSDLAPFLLYEKRRARNGFGKHKMLAKVCFRTRYDFEHWIAPNMCPSNQHPDYRLVEKAHLAADYVRNKPQVQTLAEKLRTNRAAMTESELYAVRTEPLFINMHTVPVQGADSSVRGTVILAGIDRLLHGDETEYVTADMVNQRFTDCRRAQLAAFRYALGLDDSTNCLDYIKERPHALVGGAVQVMPALLELPPVSSLDPATHERMGAAAHYSYNISQDKLAAAARRSQELGVFDVPPPEFAMFGIVTSKLHYIVNQHEVNTNIYAAPSMSDGPHLDKWDSFSLLNFAAGVRPDDPEYGKFKDVTAAVEPDFFMSDEDWSAMNRPTDRFEFLPQPGSFAALDEIWSRTKVPLYPKLAADSPEFERRMGGMKLFIESHPRLVAQLGREFLVAMQLVDYMACLKRPIDLFCRQLALPHMDTKFIERHHSMLHELFGMCIGDSYPPPKNIWELPDLPDEVLPKPRATAVAPTEDGYEAVRADQPAEIAAPSSAPAAVNSAIDEAPLVPENSSLTAKEQKVERASPQQTGSDATWAADSQEVSLGARLSAEGNEVALERSPSETHDALLAAEGIAVAAEDGPSAPADAATEPEAQQLDLLAQLDASLAENEPNHEIVARPEAASNAASAEPDAASATTAEPEDTAAGLSEDVLGLSAIGSGSGAEFHSTVLESAFGAGWQNLDPGFHSIVPEVEPQVLKSGGPRNTVEEGYFDALTIAQARTGRPMRRGFRGFLQRWSFRDKPDMVRVRVLDPALLYGWFGTGLHGTLDLSLELDALKQLKGPFQHVIICENEVSCLALPHITNTIALFGSGYAALLLATVPFMHTHDIIYWGDIDTHGFDILNHLRSALMEVRLEVTRRRFGSADPDFSYRDLNVRSMFMDQATFMCYRHLCSHEDKLVVRPMPALTKAELECYEDLISHKHGSKLRLEQEYIPYEEVLAKLEVMLPEETIVAPAHIK